MLPDEKIGCHRLARKCRDGVTNEHCQLWINVRGRDPQTGVEADRWGCADSFLPMLLIENANQTRQTGAAVESFRNEVAAAEKAAARERNETVQRIMGSGALRLTG